MATNIKTLTESNGDILIPRTTTTAITVAGSGDSLDSVLSNKVDKVTGKVLSTNDYTTIEKNKVSNIPTNTNTELGNKVDKVTGKGLSTNDYTTIEKNKVTNLPENTTQEIGTISAQLAETGQRIDNIIVTPAVGVSEQEILDARQGKGSLGANIAEVKSQLAETEKQVYDSDSSFLGELFVDSFDDQYEMLHPSVKAFDVAWNGYKYWMAYTPMPANKNPRSDRYECPSIAVSNNLVDWTIPVGFINPIVDLTPSQISNGDYFSDPSIVMNGSTMEIWYRWTNGANTDITDIYRVTSTNGIIWSTPQKVLDSQNSSNGLGLNKSFRSQQLFYDGIKYRAYTFGYGYTMSYCEITDPATGVWSTPVKCNLINPPTPLNLWHGGIYKDGTRYHMIGFDLANEQLVYFVSENGVDFVFKKIIATSNNRIKGFYQSYPFKDGNTWNLMMTIRTENTLTTWDRYGLVLLQGLSLENLTMQKQNFFQGHLYVRGSVVLANNDGNPANSNKLKFITQMSKDRVKKYAYFTDGASYTPMYQFGTSNVPLAYLYGQTSSVIPPVAEGVILKTADKMIYVSVLDGGTLVWRQLTTDGVNQMKIVNTNRKDVTSGANIDVAGAYRVVVATAGGVTDVTNFINGIDGQEIFVLNVTPSVITIQNSASGDGAIKFDQAKANLTLKPYEGVSLIKVGANWYIK